jgi:(p)ppGpp synthase/HD superfamily hydrolase
LDWIHGRGRDAPTILWSGLSIRGSNIMAHLAHAIAITASAFVDKVDKAGVPYIFHCITVMNAMPKDDYELRSIAVMHDLIEDTEWTLTDLNMEGFSARVLTALQLLTHEPDVEYDFYIKFLAHNDDARRVKLADLRHNSDITRLKGLTKKDFERMEKYHRAYTFLKY